MSGPRRGAFSTVRITSLSAWTLALFSRMVAILVLTACSVIEARSMPSVISTWWMSPVPTLSSRILAVVAKLPPMPSTMACRRPSAYTRSRPGRTARVDLPGPPTAARASRLTSSIIRWVKASIEP